MSERVGQFYYVAPSEDFEAWGMRFPSGFVIVEWVPVGEDTEPLAGAHQSLYHSWDDFRTVCSGRVDWGVSPADFAQELDGDQA